MNHLKTSFAKCAFLFGLISIPAVFALLVEVFMNGPSNADHYHIVWVGYLLLFPALFGFILTNENRLLFRAGLYAYFGWILILGGTGLFFVLKGQDHGVPLGYGLLLLIALAPLLLLLLRFYPRNTLRKISFLMGPLYLALIAIMTSLL